MLSFPFLKKGGIVFAMQGEMNDEEIQRLSGIERIQYRLRQVTFLGFLSVISREQSSYLKRNDFYLSILPIFML